MRRRLSFRVIYLLLTLTIFVFILLISIGYTAIESTYSISGNLVYNNRILYNQVYRDALTRSRNVYVYAGDTSTFKGNKKIYYYYGAETNNNVIFAGYCWKMVRTTDTGGVKIIYNGVPSSSMSCDNTEEASLLTMEDMGTDSVDITFNLSAYSLADIGYMFNTRYTNLYMTMTNTKFRFGNSFTWDGTNYTLTDTIDITDWDTQYNTINNNHYTCYNSTGVCQKLKYVYYTTSTRAYAQTLTNGESIEDVINSMLYNTDVNKNDSNIKKVVDYWYGNNMTTYTKYLEDTVWCNNRIVGNMSDNGWNPNGGSPTQYFRFTTSTDLTCPNLLDSFTVSTENGNGALKYPVGLITRPEASRTYKSSESYLAIGKKFWTMSPGVHYNYHVDGIAVYENGSYLINNVSDLRGVRPMVSLKSGIEYSSGNGSIERPYVILLD